MNRAQLLVVLSLTAIGCTKTDFQIDDRAVIWDGGGDGVSWSDPGNWNADIVPTGDDQIVIRGSDVTIDDLVTINELGELHIIDARVTIAANKVLSNYGLIRLDNGHLYTANHGSLYNDGAVEGLGDVVFACEGASGGSGTTGTGVGDEYLSCTTCVDANFDFIPAGSEIDTQYSGVLLISAINASGGPNKVITFDSANPTGDDDDLATPGTGIDNDTALGGLAIIAENDIDSDGDGLVDDPDDNAGGGTIIFDFGGGQTGETCTVQVTEVSLVDIEEQNANIELIDTVPNPNGGADILDIVHTETVPALDNNSFISLDLTAAPLAKQLRINLPGSGGVANVRFCVPSI